MSAFHVNATVTGYRVNALDQTIDVFASTNTGDATWHIDATGVNSILSAAGVAVRAAADPGVGIGMSTLMRAAMLQALSDQLIADGKLV